MYTYIKKGREKKTHTKQEILKAKRNATVKPVQQKKNNINTN